MTEQAKQRAGFPQLSTGVRGLDEILGGGLPEYSFNIIAGAPGSGKTTLAHQIVFANATAERPALYFTVLGESALKMVRYQQQYAFFDAIRLGSAVRFVNLSETLMQRGLDAVYAAIEAEVVATDPGLVVVDSFRNVAEISGHDGGTEIEVQRFLQRLAMLLASWHATTFLLGEYSPDEVSGNAVFTICDGLIWLSQETERNSVVRKLQVVKLRGQASVPGLHSIRITGAGMQAFSRTLGLGKHVVKKHPPRRLSVGIPELDAMLGGGIPEGDSMLVAGPSGTGKSVMASQFIAEGIRVGEPGIIAVFEERPDGYAVRARSLGMDLHTPQEDGRLEILYLRPLDLSVDETMQTILDTVERMGAKRLVIDSLVGFEMALTPGFRLDFRESLYRMMAALTGAGVTVVSTVEVEDKFTAFEFSHYAISFLTDDIIRMRYVEIDGQIRKILVVVKTRRGNHSKDIREYVITEEGLVIILPRTAEYRGLTTGNPEYIGGGREAAPEAKAGPEGEQTSAARS
jgi:circadian clock protein KaiC